MSDNVLYSTNDIIIYTNVEDIAAVHWKKLNCILLYRVANFHWAPNIDRLSGWTAGLICTVFAKANITVRYDQTYNQFVMTDEKEKFQFKLKYGDYRA